MEFRKPLSLDGDQIRVFLEKLVADALCSADLLTQTLDLTKEFRAKDYPLIHLLLQNPLQEFISMGAPNPTEVDPQQAAVPGYLYLFDGQLPIETRRADDIQWSESKKMNVKLIIYNEGNSQYKLKNNKSDEGNVVMRRQTWRADGDDRGWRRNEYKIVLRETYFKQAKDGRLVVSEGQSLQDFPVLVHYFWKRESPTERIPEAPRPRGNKPAAPRPPAIPFRPPRLPPKPEEGEGGSLPTSMLEQLQTSIKHEREEAEDASTDEESESGRPTKKARIHPVPPSVPTFAPEDTEAVGNDEANGNSNTTTTTTTTTIASTSTPAHELTANGNSDKPTGPTVNSSIPQLRVDPLTFRFTQLQNSSARAFISQLSQLTQGNKPNSPLIGGGLGSSYPYLPQSPSASVPLSPIINSTTTTTTTSTKPLPDGLVSSSLSSSSEGGSPPFVVKPEDGSPRVSDDESVWSPLPHNDHKGPLADIKTYAPDNGPSTEYTKIVLYCTGFDLEPDKSYRFSCVFEDTVVNAAQLAPGVLECHAPPHKGGIVYFWISCIEEDVSGFDGQPPTTPSPASPPPPSPAPLSSSCEGKQEAPPKMPQISRPVPFYYLPVEETGRLTLAWELIGVNDLTPVMRAFKYHAKELDLSNNNLSNVDFLEGFKELHTLILDNNHITQNAKFPLLPKLHTLCINHNWLIEIDKFMDHIVDSVPSLRYLSTLHNPACPFFSPAKHHYYNYRIYILSRLRNLTHLDSSPVTMEEWRHAACIIPPDPTAESMDEFTNFGTLG